MATVVWDRLIEVGRRVIEQRDMLTELDRAIGDADHGVNMARGFQAVAEKGSPDEADVGATLKKAGMTLLSTVGGAIGVVVGVVAANVIGEINHWPIVIEASSAIYSFLFSSFVGMFFGFYPAYRASKLNPIECLRYE